MKLALRTESEKLAPKTESEKGAQKIGMSYFELPHCKPDASQGPKSIENRRPAEFAYQER